MAAVQNKIDEATERLQEIEEELDVNDVCAQTVCDQMPDAQNALKAAERRYEQLKRSACFSFV